ncbi:MAG: ATPase, T2SS/T4P/T4SS family [bacterium]
MFTVIVSEKGGQQSTFEFSKTEITIGRMKGNDIVLPKGNVSKKHSRIILQDGGFSVSDLGSTNGTYVNGRKIAGEQPITDADKIYIGDFVLNLEAHGQPAVAPPPPPPGPPMGGAALPPIDLGDIDIEPDLDLDDGPMLTPPRVDSVPRATTPGEQLPDPRPPMPTDAGSIPGRDSGWQVRQNDDVTVDRPGDRLVAQAVSRSRGASAVIASSDLQSEFDADFHAAQYDVAMVLFENVGIQDLPLTYPSPPEERQRFEQAVQSAVRTVNPRVDHKELVQLITAECVGLGPIETYLDDPSVKDVYVNRFDRVLIRRNGSLVAARRAFSHPSLLLIAAYRLLGPRDVEVMADEVRFSDGTKAHVVMPPLAVDGPVITIRKPNTQHDTLSDLAQAGVMSPGIEEFLARAMLAGRSILVAGPTSSGKSTLLSGLLQLLPAGLRAVCIEDNANLALPAGAVRLEANPLTGYDARFLVRTAMSMHPQRIVVDEMRGPEAYEWVTSAAAGTEGSLATMHGTSAADSLGRLESLCLLGSRDVSPRGLREQIARAVNLVVVVNRVREGGFRIQQISEVQGVDLDAFRLNDIFYFRAEGAKGGFHPTGYVPMFYEDLRHAGVNVDFGIFRE